MNIETLQKAQNIAHQIMEVDRAIDMWESQEGPLDPMRQHYALVHMEVFVPANDAMWGQYRRHHIERLQKLRDRYTAELEAL